MNAQDLTKMKCSACTGEDKPFDREKAEQYIDQMPSWEMAPDAKSISRDYVMKNFQAALDFINKVGALAEGEGHHPDLHLTGYRKLKIVLSTHKIGGLSESDFILAAKINDLPAELKT
jgi:4a-hydroxytetrahydrobiopterin dehydratase